MKKQRLYKGISVYLGEESIENIEKYLIVAQTLGFSRVFTSLHIPEADFDLVIEKFEKLAKLCTRQSLHLMADISSYTFKFMGIEKFITWLEMLKVPAIRVDFGLSSEEIVALSKIGDFKVVLNASTVLPHEFEMLEKLGLNCRNIEVSHNFYPRSETGIPENFFRKQSHYFQKRNILVTAFIPGRSGRRGPIYDGLPTLEEHRFMRSSLAFRHLSLLGCEGIYFGDNKVSEDELEEIGKLKDAVALECDIFDKENEWIFNTLHTERPDSSEFVIRSQESRLLLSSGGTKIMDNILPKHCFKRDIGAITIDNCEYARYMGELQIAKISLREDSRVNVIGHVQEDNLFLLKYIKHGRQYYFVKRKDY